tara:strand:+ start:599 stop:1048 length:450 start_codon:yes stop_codon:yes gene_type:complete
MPTTTNTYYRGLPIGRPYLTTIFTWDNAGTVKVLIDEIWVAQGYGNPIASVVAAGAGNELTLNCAAPFIPSKWLDGSTVNSPLQSYSVGTASWASFGFAGSLDDVYTPFFYSQDESTNSQLRLFSQGEYQNDGVPSSAIEFRLYPALIV